MSALDLRRIKTLKGLIDRKSIEFNFNRLAFLAGLFFEEIRL